MPPVSKWSATPLKVRREAPRLGEHSEELLRELGYPPAAIAELRANGTTSAPIDRRTAELAPAEELPS